MMLDIVSVCTLARNASPGNSGGANESKAGDVQEPQELFVSPVPPAPPVPLQI